MITLVIFHQALSILQALAKGRYHCDGGELGHLIGEQLHALGTIILQSQQPTDYGFSNPLANVLS